MLKKFLIMTMCYGVIALSGCGYKMHAYVARRERVDQGRPEAYNFDPAQPQKPPAPPAEPVKTREVIVVEMVKTDSNKAASGDSSSPASSVSSDQSAQGDVHNESAASSLTPPTQDNLRNLALSLEQAQREGTTYTVQKDDTLQKIAKKFYGNYGQWTKIYEANRPQIKDPNFLKTGIILTIP